MTKEDKDLLLKDLCPRLPYGVMCDISKYKETYYNSNLGHDIYRQVLHPVRVTGYHNGLITFDSLEIDSISVSHDLDKFKSYLRPMSSMTEKECREYYVLCHSEEDSYGHVYYYDTVESIDWLIEHHFDYRGLIEKGLALEAPEDMYK